MKKEALISSLDTIITDCKKTIEETYHRFPYRNGDTRFVLNRLEQVIKDLKLLKSYSLSETAKKKAKRIKNEKERRIQNLKWKLRNGKIITDKQMTQRRLNTADMYNGKIKASLSISVNHKLAKRIQEP
jgi:hypothetical protein